ncbi:MAG: hypothetical protein ABFS42_09895 [Candidatus Krumholzibacteriota bacterium]
MEPGKKEMKELAAEYARRGDPLGWFEDIYLQADGDADKVL